MGRTQLPFEEAGQWRTDCWLLRLAVENIDPPMPDAEATATFTANGLEWTVYDSGPRDGTQMVAKAALLAPAK